MPSSPPDPNAWTLEEELTLLPDNNTGDGFYAARLLRNAQREEPKS